MYIVTGAAGFIGSALVWYLNIQGIDNIWVVDDSLTAIKAKNIEGLRYRKFLEKNEFLDLVLTNQIAESVEAVIHLGACSATTEKNWSFLYENNIAYTQILCEWCIKSGIRYIYASSAATYGDGELGFNDDHEEILGFKPLNLYAKSKQTVDEWALAKGYLDKVVGLKFFNVFGPNENHKGSMRSMVCKAVEQIQKTGKLQLFKSYLPEYGDGEQVRDFIYVKDVVKAVFWLITKPEINGIFNLGSGVTNTWKSLAEATFVAMERPINIEFIPMPDSVINQYQYFTQAEMSKFINKGYDTKWTPLGDAVSEYVKEYLLPNKNLMS